MQAQMPYVVEQKRSSGFPKILLACCLAPVIIAACLMLCACGALFAFANGGPDPLYADFKPDSTLAAQYENRMAAAVADAGSGGNFTVSFTDKEFASWLNLELDQYLDENEVQDEDTWRQLDPEFQAKFDNNEIHFYANFDLRITKFAMLVTGTISPVSSTAFSDQLLDIQITGMEFGAFDVGQENIDNSQDLGDTLSEILTDQLVDYAELQGKTVTITSVTAEGGTLTLQGSVN
ncbi:MAG: hypothetical protein H6673_03465 [Anaerolineales bacterium]|nr:hypothetical protein [Anaerolineales bacterium]